MSRKLDALVAEKVFGWKLEPVSGLWMWIKNPDSGQYTQTSGRFLPDFSTTWAGMGEVVEKMEAEGWQLAAYGRAYMAGFVFGETGEPVMELVDVQKGGFVMAVIVSALRAKGVPGDEIQAALKGDDKSNGDTETTD